MGTDIAVAVVQQQNNDVSRLMEIASGAAGGNPGDIYVAVGNLVDRESASLSAQERALAADILRRLSRSVEMSLRAALAERIADDENVPRELLVLLADDAIEVARPILLRNSALTDDDLLHVIKSGSVDHQVCVATRPEISVTVSAALVSTQSDKVAIALVQNSKAKIGPASYVRLVELSQEIGELQQGLIQRSDLPPEVATRLYPLVSDALKNALTNRYPKISQTLASAIDKTTASLQRGVASTSESNAAKLVAKLMASGDLKPSFLIRTLHQGQLDTFEHGFAVLLGIDVANLRIALYSEPPSVAAMACRAAGIDKAVFLTVFGMSRHARRRPFALTSQDQGQTDAVFATMSKDEAAARIKQRFLQ